MNNLEDKFYFGIGFIEYRDEEHNTDIVDMSTNDGICLLTGKWTNSNCKEDCRDCEIYKMYMEENIEKHIDK